MGKLKIQFFDLKTILQQFSNFQEDNLIFVFLGDYIDRGSHGIETITLLFLLKLKYPQNFYLLRGNHETKQLTQTYGFFMECQFKYEDNEIWNFITNTFNYLPIAALLNQENLAIHGGLCPGLEFIIYLQGFQEPQFDSLISNIMWSDPNDKIEGFDISPRGSGYLFGSQVLQTFLQNNKLKKILRSHQLCFEGYLVKQKGTFQLVSLNCMECTKLLLQIWQQSNSINTQQRIIQFF